jgi:Peptidase_C39 like family
VTRFGVLAAGFAAAALLLSAPAFAKQPFALNYKTFALSGGAPSGVTWTGDSLELASSGYGSFEYTDPFSAVSVLGMPVDGSGTYDSGTWTSDWTTLSFPFNELVSSWNSKTPPGTWIQSEVQPRLDNGTVAKWYILGRWSYGDIDSQFHRTSVRGQGDADGYVAIDTFFTKDHPAVAYRLRLTLFRRQGSGATPEVSRYSAIVSDLTNQKNQFPSATTMGGTTKDLGLTPYSQETHHGHYPEFDNGGEAWCSPTSTAMVVKYWGSPYVPTDTSWVMPDNDPEVDYTARFVYDYNYRGAGNWPFNTAYASERGLVADVTQLHNLAEAEAFIKDGVPLVASVAWESNKLTGAIKSTNGHLLVIGGFTGGGDVIAYDPAHETDDEVRQVYDRREFERAWIPASGGIVYVIRPAGHALPSLTGNNL